MQLNQAVIGINMLSKIIISLVMIAVIVSTITAGIISAALALFAFTLLFYHHFTNE